MGLHQHGRAPHFQLRQVEVLLALPRHVPPGKRSAETRTLVLDHMSAQKTWLVPQNMAGQKEKGQSMYEAVCPYTDLQTFDGLMRDAEQRFNRAFGHSRHVTLGITWLRSRIEQQVSVHRGCRQAEEDDAESRRPPTKSGSSM